MKNDEWVLYLILYLVLSQELTHSSLSSVRSPSLPSRSSKKCKSWAVNLAKSLRSGTESLGTEVVEKQWLLLRQLFPSLLNKPFLHLSVIREKQSIFLNYLLPIEWRNIDGLGAMKSHLKQVIFSNYTTYTHSTKQFISILFISIKSKKHYS
jgi:hypothetical protein